MRRSDRGCGAVLVGLGLAVAGCDEGGLRSPFPKEDAGSVGVIDANVPRFTNGQQVDLDGDGISDGVAVDSDGDGIADGVDTNGDGKKDEELPETGGLINGGASGGSGNVVDGGFECQEYVVRNEQVTPDMLIVLDRSGSMDLAFGLPDGVDCTKQSCEGVNCNFPPLKGTTVCGGATPIVDRWAPSVAAIKDLTASLDSLFRFGLMAFPQDNECGDGSVLVTPDLGTASAIATQLDGLSPKGGTPTGGSLNVARDALSKLGVGPDEAPRPKYVLLVTDGQPTCPAGEGTSITQADFTLATGALDGLRGDGVKTYVIGYDTKKDATFASAMDKLAEHGGTGTHRPVEDQATLAKEFESIASSAISCTFALERQPEDPSYVLVKVDGQQINYNTLDGWTINGKTIELQGASCALLQDGKKHTLNVQVQCDIVIPI
jgi:hypothetical protein